MSETFSNGGGISKADKKAAKKEAQKAAREAAAAERAEQKAAKKAEREEEVAQKKAKKKPAKRPAKKKAAETEATDDAVEQGAERLDEAASADAPAESQETTSSTLPAKVEKEKKPKKARQTKAKASKEVRRAIRPIRSKSQQTTARLIWAVFGMALVIVAIVGFWVVLSNQDDSTEVTLLVTANDLTAGEFLAFEDIAFLTRDDDGTTYLSAGNENDLIGRVILQDVPENTPLGLFMLGEVVVSSFEAEDSESEITFPLELPGGGQESAAAINAGDRVVIYVTQSGSESGSDDKDVFDVVDVAAFESSISIEGSYEDRGEWERRLSNYRGTGEGNSYQFELERVDSANSPYHIDCFKARFGNIYGFDTTVPGYPVVRELADCPPEWLSGSAPSPEPSDTGASSEDGGDGLDLSGIDLGGIAPGAPDDS